MNANLENLQKQEIPLININGLSFLSEPGFLPKESTKSFLESLTSEQVNILSSKVCLNNKKFAPNELRNYLKKSCQSTIDQFPNLNLGELVNDLIETIKNNVSYNVEIGLGANHRESIKRVLS